MKKQGSLISLAPTYLRAPRTLDDVLEEMARRERRTKVAVVSLSLEEYAKNHHPDLYAKYKEAAHEQ
jgi:hypothetical protein